MKRYEKYKDSGVEWIGEIPEGWEVQKGQSLFNIAKEVISKGQLDNFFVYHYSIPSVQNTNDAYYEDGKGIDSDKFTVFGDELLYSKLNPRKETVVITKKRNALQVCSTEFLVIKPLKFNLKFAFHLFKSHFLKEEICSTVQSATKSHQRANPGEIHRMYYPLPPLSEQTIIADYLDQKTSQIDNLIEGKKRLMELLQEERTAIINQAVTKGLDPNVKFKDSGIDWLGEIPEGWEVKKLRYLSKIYTGSKNTEDRVENGEYPFFVRSQTVEHINTYSFDGEAILTAGDGVGVGKVFHYHNGKFDFHQRVYAIVQISEIYGSLLFHYISNCLSKELYRWNAKSTVDSLRLPLFQNFPVAFSQSPSEQKKISDFIQKETARIRRVSEAINHEIELLQEYRNALISEVVTGKVKVV
ncbi:restriction endonuclease subunit S [Leptospira koniambonensis]|uniref:Restriction endonuclease subunit S n=1 Tax=Leptospira koniambonensis TaxID=2484950 RepID=A0A4R9J1L2_9LEPT|nr:restriction endonuclease subunit S [Leptospira koniambonensis]TGL28158.1 restriction endonuclease subunit S [Leptospira koniambonensis]